MPMQAKNSEIGDLLPQFFHRYN